MFIKSPSTDLIIVLVIVLLIFGKRLPGLGRQLGQGMREFKDGITGSHKDDEAESRPALTAASAPAPQSGSAERQSAEVGSQPHA